VGEVRVRQQLAALWAAMGVAEPETTTMQTVDPVAEVVEVPFNACCNLAMLTLSLQVGAGEVAAQHVPGLLIMEPFKMVEVEVG